MAGILAPGEVLLLYGDIGAGKSVLARGIVHGLPGGEGLTVRSPTFVFVRHYPTRPPVHHIDLYRLPMDTSPEEIGLEEWTDPGSVTIIDTASIERTPKPTWWNLAFCPKNAHCFVARS